MSTSLIATNHQLGTKNMTDPKTITAAALKKASDTADTVQAIQKAAQAAVAPKAPAVNPPGIVKRSSAYYADPATIGRREDWNPRFDFGEMEELAQSIRENGLLNPLRVKRITPANGKVFELIDGDRRLTAIEEFLLKGGKAFTDIPSIAEGIPVVIVDKAQDDVTSLIQMFVANTGKNFLPMEEAVAYQKMRDAGMTVKAICKAVGRKEMHVSEIMALLEADDEVKEAATSGEIGKTQAKQIAKHAKGDKEAQKTLTAAAKAANKGDKEAKKTLDKGLDAARRAKAAKKGKALKIRALDDSELSKIGALLASTMADRMKEAGKPLDFDLQTWVTQDDKLALAATYGALQALKAAAGMKVELTF
jgi:ParB/RepB/Spo0J family partition protein